ncbi:MAG TPA: hypothetical protein VNB06_09245 [Thermoanaerobaculia bacterium]|nr:hypothetical protein [Thermoanaerobaculia bacterium]
MRHFALSSAISLAACSLAFASAAAAQVVNSPVAPDAIYVGRLGAIPGLSVIDLNGFGQGTGDPSFDFTYQTFPEGNSNFPNNPNVKLQGVLLRPPLFPGTSTLDGGSAGVSTLAKNSALQGLVLGAPEITSVGDMMLGHPLDVVYHAGLEPSGCTFGGGNLCAVTAKKILDPAVGGPNTVQPSFYGGSPLVVQPGRGNPISWSPHPNPPPLISPPICVQPLIEGQEPTAFETIATHGLVNLLVPGDPLGNPALGIPPSGLLVEEQNTFFAGPSLSGSPFLACLPYQQRQQIGHFLYVTDRARAEVVVLNSNRFTVLQRIALPDPTELAMGTNLDLLAVTNQLASSVSFIDIHPSSPTFHQVIQTTPVGKHPRGIAWEPGNEDVLVCNEGDDTVSILSTVSLQVRKTLHRGLDRPFAVAITPRQTQFGYLRNVYFAYILDRAGRVSLFESGPSGINGWGYDEIIGRTPFALQEPRAMQPDPLRLTSGVWIAHVGQVDPNGQPTGLAGGALSNLVLDSGSIGTLPLNATNFITPQMRDLAFRVEASIGSDQLTGIPTDLAFDDQRNLGALPNPTTGPGAGARLNGKNLVRNYAGQWVNTNEASYLFAAVPASGGAGGIDVIDLSTKKRIDTNAHQPGIQSIPAGSAAVVMGYFRQ